MKYLISQRLFRWGILLFTIGLGLILKSIDAIFPISKDLMLVTSNVGSYIIGVGFGFFTACSSFSKSENNNEKQSR